MLDDRLSQPKQTQLIDNGKVFRNSTQAIQKEHQDRVYRTSQDNFGKLVDAENGDGYYPMEANVVSYNRLQKPTNSINMQK